MFVPVVCSIALIGVNTPPHIVGFSLCLYLEPPPVSHRPPYLRLTLTSLYHATRYFCDRTLCHD